MRTLVDLPEELLEDLNAISQRERRSRAAVVREALGIYVASHRVAPQAAFGLWGQRREDGLDYQNRVRDEW